MADARLRARERAWQQCPDDPEAVAGLIAARRRAGLEVPGWLLDQQVHPGRAFEPGAPFEVFADLPEGGIRHLGATTRATGLAVPPHHAWWVQPPGAGRALPDVLALVREHRVPGLALPRAQLTARDLAAAGELPGLTWLSLAGCGRLDAEALSVLAERAPGLRHLELDRCGRGLRVRQDALRGLPDLIHLFLRDRAGDADVAEVVAGAPKLTRLRIGGRQLTNEGVERLAALSDLTRLEVGFAGRVSARGIEALAALPRLLHLDLVACARAKGPSLGKLARLQHLISLGYYPVGRWGLLRGADATDLRGLARLTRLEHLALLDLATRASPALTAAERSRLEAALPECQVTYVASLDTRLLGPVSPEGPPAG